MPAVENLQTESPMISIKVGHDSTNSQEFDMRNTTGPDSNIFGKANEFGADERRFSSKVNCLEYLLHNYSGLSGMKEEFTKMLYSSSSKFFLTKGGRELQKDGKKLNR